MSICLPVCLSVCLSLSLFLSFYISFSLYLFLFFPRSVFISISPVSSSLVIFLYPFSLIASLFLSVSSSLSVYLCLSILSLSSLPPPSLFVFVLFLRAMKQVVPILISTNRLDIGLTLLKAVKETFKICMDCPSLMFFGAEKGGGGGGRV